MDAALYALMSLGTRAATGVPWLRRRLFALQDGSDPRLPPVAHAGDRGPERTQSVLGSWVCVRHLFHVFLFLTASRMVLPKILVLNCFSAVKSRVTPPTT